MATSSFSGHLVGMLAPVWGHLKPLAALASRIAQERSDILITLLVVGDYTARVEKEINRYFPGNTGESPRCNIRVINMGGKATDDMFTLLYVVGTNFGLFYTKLANLEPVTCSTGKSYDTPIRPNLAIVDCLFPEFVLAIRKTSENSSPVTVLGWNAGNASCVLRILGPEKYGGYGDVEGKARELAAATGRNADEIENELFFPATGAVIRIPGSPPVFDYELTPQQSQIDEFQKAMFKKSYQFMTLCDGMIATTSAVFEPEAHEAWRQWLSETNRTYYPLGPLQSQGFETGTLAESVKQNELSNSQNGQELLEFLDKTLQTNGPNSLLYISWGTIFWPKGEYVWKLIDVLLDLKFPFILAHVSPMAIIPAEVSAKVTASGIGMLTPWAPQQLILAHPATGWFLTHCGQNSVTESIIQGIPMIAWPVAVDQPINAARIAITLDMAFEPVEVRTGHVLKPLYRGVTPQGTIEAAESEFYQILRDARGPVGDRKRRNIHTLRDVQMGAWAEGGLAIKALRQLLSDHLPRTN